MADNNESFFSRFWPLIVVGVILILLWLAAAATVGQCEISSVPIASGIWCNEGCQNLSDNSGNNCGCGS